MAHSLPSSIVTPIVAQAEFHLTLRFWCHKQIIGEACGKKQQCYELVEWRRRSQTGPSVS
jgi:hypothetical protein